MFCLDWEVLQPLPNIQQQHIMEAETNILPFEGIGTTLQDQIVPIICEFQIYFVLVDC